MKYLHHRATQFDIGVYFEANGHGTVLFSGDAQKKLSAAAKDTELVQPLHTLSHPTALICGSGRFAFYL